MKKRKHTLVINVTFNRACSTRHAHRAVRGELLSFKEFYPAQGGEKDPWKFTVRSIQHSERKRA